MYTHSIHYAVILYNKDLIFILTDINMQDCKAEQNTYYVNLSIHNISCLIDYQSFEHFANVFTFFF